MTRTLIVLPPTCNKLIQSHRSNDFRNVKDIREIEQRKILQQLGSLRRKNNLHSAI